MFEFLREHRRKPTHASQGDSEAFLAEQGLDWKTENSTLTIPGQI